MNSSPGLFFLFKSFLKIGLTSFGGHAALVSVLQEELVKKKEIISQDSILDGMSISSLLPGPLAVNVVTYIGYKLNGWPGAITSMFAVLLPPFILMILIARLYGIYGNTEAVSSVLAGVIPVIIGIILSLCYNMSQKHISRGWQYVLAGIILLLAFFFNSYLWIVVFIITGGIVGFLVNENDKSTNRSKIVEDTSFGRNHLFLGFGTIFLMMVSLFFLLKGEYRLLLTEFGKVSLTLFGGGYVMIPILYEIVVDKFDWLSSREFADAIAFGQMTPGPILVSATYVGYKVGGIFGAIFATMGIFIPSGVLMVIVGSLFEEIKENKTVLRIMKGVRPVIIALIAYSGWILFSSLDNYIISALLAIISFSLITFTRINYFVLIIVAGLLGFIIY